MNGYFEEVQARKRIKDENSIQIEKLPCSKAAIAPRAVAEKKESKVRGARRRRRKRRKRRWKQRWSTNQMRLSKWKGEFCIHPEPKSAPLVKAYR